MSEQASAIGERHLPDGTLKDMDSLIDYVCMSCSSRNPSSGKQKLTRDSLVPRTTYYRGTSATGLTTLHLIQINTAGTSGQKRIIIPTITSSRFPSAPQRRSPFAVCDRGDGGAFVVRLDPDDAEILVGFAAQHQPTDTPDMSDLFPSEQSRSNGCAYLNSLLQEGVNALVHPESNMLPWHVERLRWQKLSEDELRTGGREAVVETARRERQQGSVVLCEDDDQRADDGESEQSGWYKWLQQQTGAASGRAAS